MNEFETQLLKFVEEFKCLQNDENTISMRAQMINGRFQDFLKSNSIPEKFTIAELLQLAIKKSRE